VIQQMNEPNLATRNQADRKSKKKNLVSESCFVLGTFQEELIV
jgi:hypothetical protein